MFGRYYEESRPAIVCLLNIEPGTSEADVRTALSEFGPILHVFISAPEPSRPPSSTVVFSRLSDARNAVQELHEAEANGRILTATLIQPTPRDGLSLLLRMSEPENQHSHI
ncbi:hypothetical protein MJO28_001925 [Puccinia striiformis f. sp. tritici]|uniref:RRM domain-containing protein n=2 Tax=Puccinia striiformis TaxID=27350 RepID=A0A2S4VXE4_9BASI|nr:hypothetical protein MJO28_001925 [Puccinia striiformis f. sp. tritici]POW14168.1 hypothetical protein PSTT_03229 [Puccinia striiformis]